MMLNVEGHWGSGKKVNVEGHWGSGKKVQSKLQNAKDALDLIQSPGTPTGNYTCTMCLPSSILAVTGGADLLSTPKHSYC